MTPQTGNLWALQGHLFELLEFREESLEAVKAAERSNPELLEQAQEELRAIESAIGDFVAQKVSDVTELRASYFGLTDAAAIAKKEADRATNRALLLESRAARLKDLIKLCMETIGATRFDSAMGYFLIKGNGGMQPVTITDESLVPDELCEVSVKMTFDQWMKLGTAAFAHQDVTVGPRTLRKGLIGKLLASGQPVAGARLEDRSKSLVIK